jgi:hypothetical protein
MREILRRPAEAGLLRMTNCSSSTKQKVKPSEVNGLCNPFPHSHENPSWLQNSSGKTEVFVRKAKIACETLNYL